MFPFLVVLTGGWSDLMSPLASTDNSSATATAQALLLGFVLVHVLADQMDSLADQIH